MTKQEYIQKELKRWELEIFKDHIAELKPVSTSDPRFTPPMLILWRKPEHWNHACYYTIFSQWVMCCGDLFEAQYQWSENVTPRFLAGIDFGYFMSKMRASPEGRKWETWNEEVAKEFMAAEIKEFAGESSSQFRMRDILTVNDYSQEAIQIVAGMAYDETGDSEHASSIHCAGLVPDAMSIGQFVGLQMALRQIMNPQSTITK